MSERGEINFFSPPFVRIVLLAFFLGIKEKICRRDEKCEFLFYFVRMEWKGEELC